MPAQAGIQVHSARALGEAAWIPGLALFARNDEDENSLHISCVRYLAHSAYRHVRQQPPVTFTPTTVDKIHDTTFAVARND